MSTPDPTILPQTTAGEGRGPGQTQVTPGSGDTTEVPDAGANPTGAAPPPAPSLGLGDLTAALGLADTKPVDPEVSAGERLYFQIWGTKPPKGYIEGLVKNGMNIFEIEQHELSKPGAKRTRYYQGKFSDYAATLAQAMGFR